MKKIIPIIIIVALLGGAGAFALSRSGEPKSNTNQQTSSNTDMSTMDMSDEPTPQNETEETQTAQETSSVEIRNYAFSPGTIRVKKGTTVTWTNHDSIGHDITPTGGGDDFKASDLLNNGESYSFTFNTAGTYTYKCSPHPYMTGTVEVIE